MEDKVRIQYNLSDIANSYLLHIKLVTESVSQIYHAVLAHTYDLRPLPTNNLPLFIDDKQKPKSIEERSKITLDWLFEKAFEDIIKGLHLSLSEAYFFLNVVQLQKKELESVSAIRKEIDRIRMRSKKEHIPNLIESIESLLKNKLDYRDEVLSVNKVRNCLVHRGGIVGEADLKHSHHNELVLMWRAIKNFTEKNGIRIPIDFGLRNHRIKIDNLDFQFETQRKSFKIGERINIIMDEFNDVCCTCALFVVELNHAMPRDVK